MDGASSPTPKRVKNGDKDGDNLPKHLEQQTKRIANAVPQIPEEVLEMIFSQLKTTRDTHAVSNACPQFARILSPTKPIWSFEEVFPRILSELDGEDILNCRQVCKQWNQVVDNTLQTCPDTRELALYPEASRTMAEKNKRPLHAPEFFPTHLAKGLSRLEFLRSYEIMDFMQYMGDHPRNPFVLRGVSLDNFEASEEYWGLVMSFLDRFGAEIWSANITRDIVDPEEMPFMVNYELACQILAHLPNLRRLWVSGFMDEDVTRPLPHMPQLDTLELLPDGDRHPFLYELIRSHSSQLKLICLFNLSNFKRYILPSLPQVTTMKLAIDINLRYWRQFCQELVAPKLAKLNLRLWIGWKVRDLLQPLSEANFHSLTYLGLVFRRTPKDNSLNLAAPLFVLEKVKTLEIVDNGNVHYDELLRYFPNLEYLLVLHEQRHGVPIVSFDDLGQWQLSKYFDGSSIYTSSIWTRLSELKELTLARLGKNEGYADNEFEIMDRKTFTREMCTRRREH